MTIKLLADYVYRGMTIPAGRVVSLLAASEAGLIADKLAVSISGASDWQPAAVSSVPSEPSSVFNLNDTATLAQLVSKNGKSKKAPIAVIGGALSVGDLTILSGSPTITVETGPNGKQALKVVLPNASISDLAIPGLAGAIFNGNAFISMHGSLTQGNVSSVAFYMSQNDTSYALGGVWTLAVGAAAPLNSYLEQGGANTYFFRRSAVSNFGAGPSYPAIVGQAKIRITPASAAGCTVYIYGVGTAPLAQKGRICVTWDDGYDSAFKLGVDSFASRGIKQTLSVIASAQDTGGTYSYTRQLRAFVDAGNACVAHGPYPALGAGNLFSAYPGSADPIADAIADMQLNRAWIENAGLGVPNFDECYVWPQGIFQNTGQVNDTALLDAAIAAGFTLARGVNSIAGSALYPHGVQLDAASKYNRMAMPIVGHLWAGTTAAEATNITAITTAIAGLSTSRTDACLMLHRVLPTATADGAMGAANNITIRHGDLETIAAAIKTGIDAGTLEAVTMPELVSQSWWSQF